MLGAFAGYGILTLYALMLWMLSKELLGLGGPYKKWGVPSLVMGSTLFGWAEILLTSRIVDKASADGQGFLYILAAAVTILNIAITCWGMVRYKKFSYKSAVFGISILAIIIGYL